MPLNYQITIIEIIFESLTLNGLNISLIVSDELRHNGPPGGAKSPETIANRGIVNIKAGS